jgi:formate/nitrite transporter
MAELELHIDALIPPEMADRAEAVGTKKAGMDFWTMFTLAVLAGAFIASGAFFSTTVMAGAGTQLTYGVTRLLGGLSFCLGLILVVIAGAELFTGNNLIVMAWAAGKVSTGKLLRNWAIVYVGNFVGSVLTAVLVFASRQYLSGGAAVGITAVKIADGKTNLDLLQALALGILCNTLVCMAVWLCYSARSTTDKILSIIFPISAFVAAGFEHSIANMYFIPYGILIRDLAGDGFWGLKAVADAGLAVDKLANLTWANFFLRNLAPVTLGNIIGGAGMVGLVYWFAYLRTANGKQPSGAPPAANLPMNRGRLAPSKK